MPYDLLDKNKTAWSIRKFKDDFQQSAGGNQFDPNQHELTDAIPLLSSAVKHGKGNAFTALLDSKANVNQVDTNLRTALHYACEKQQADMVEQLLGKDAEVNLTDKDGNTPLHLAAATGNMAIFKLLIQNKANVAALDRGGRNPLQLLSSTVQAEQFLIACKQNRKDIVLLLLQNLKAAITTSSMDSNSSQAAAGYNHESMAEMLCAAETAADQMYAASPMPLSFSVNQEEAAFVQLLNDLVDGMPLLCCAAKHKLAYAFDALLAQGASVTRTDKNKRTALHHACETQQVTMVQSLLHKGAEVNVTDSASSTPLHLAAAKDNIEIFILLLQKNASVTALDRDGKNPLQLLNAKNYTALFLFICTNVAKGPKEFTTYLSQQGVKNGKSNEAASAVVAPSVQDPVVQVLSDFAGGMPLLIYAVHADASDLFRALLLLNPNLGITDKNKRTALHHACQLQRVLMVKLLIRMKAPLDEPDETGNTPLHAAAAAAANNIEICMELITAGVAITRLNGQKQNPMQLFGDKEREELLLFACEKGRKDLVELLVRDLSVDVNAKDQNGTTVLHNAVFNGHKDIAEFLLSQGAAVNATNNTTQSTPLHFAARQGHADIIQLLMQQQADVLALDKDGLTPFMHVLVCNLKFTSQNVFSDMANIFLQRSEYGETEISERKTNENFTYLCLAILYKVPFDILEQLIIKSQNCIDHASSIGTALQVALTKYSEAQTYYQKVITKLRELGASLAVRNQKLQTPLHVAAGFESEIALKILLENVALDKKKELLAMQDEDDNTPIHIAAIDFREANYDVLLKNGSPTNIRNKTRLSKPGRIASAIYADWMKQRKQARKGSAPPSPPQQSPLVASLQLNGVIGVDGPETKSSARSEMSVTTGITGLSVMPDSARSDMPNSVRTDVPSDMPSSARTDVPNSARSDASGATGFTKSSTVLNSARTETSGAASRTDAASVRALLFSQLPDDYKSSKKDKVIRHLRNHPIAYGLASIIVITGIMCGFFALCAFVPIIAKAIPIVLAVQKIMISLGIAPASFSLLHTLAQIITVCFPVAVTLAISLVVGTGYAISRLVALYCGDKTSSVDLGKGSYELVPVRDPSSYAKVGFQLGQKDSQIDSALSLTPQASDAHDATVFGFKTVPTATTSQQKQPDNFHCLEMDCF